MAKQTINLGTPPGGVDGDTIRAALEKSNSNFDEVYASINAPGYIDGHKMIWNSGSSLTVTSGAAHVPDVGLVKAATDATKAGLSFAPSTWYHVYRWLNAGVPDIELSTTAPAAPYNGTARTKTGDASRRYIGSVRTDAASGMLKFSHAAGYVGYLGGLAGNPLSLVSNGVAAVETSFSVAGAVPMTATDLQLQLENAASNSPLFVRNPSTTGVLPPGYLASSYPLTASFVRIPLDSTFTLSYMYGATPAGGAYLRACGYFFER